MGPVWLLLPALYDTTTHVGYSSAVHGRDGLRCGGLLFKCGVEFSASTERELTRVLPPKSRSLFCGLSLLCRRECRSAVTHRLTHKPQFEQ